MKQDKRTLIETWYSSIGVGVWRNIDKIIKPWRTPTMKVLEILKAIFEVNFKELKRIIAFRTFNVHKVCRYCEHCNIFYGDVLEHNCELMDFPVVDTGSCWLWSQRRHEQ